MLQKEIPILKKHATEKFDLEKQLASLNTNMEGLEAQIHNLK